MHNNIGGVDPRAEKDVRPRPVTGTEAGVGRLAVQEDTNQADLLPARAVNTEPVSPRVTVLARSYADAMAALREQAAKLNPQPRY